jgi:hypothetical protein
MSKAQIMKNIDIFDFLKKAGDKPPREDKEEVWSTLLYQNSYDQQRAEDTFLERQNIIHQAKGYLSTLKKNQRCSLEHLGSNSTASKHVVIAISGFLSEDVSTSKDWEGFTKFFANSNDSMLFSLKWEAKTSS